MWCCSECVAEGVNATVVITVEIDKVVFHHLDDVDLMIFFRTAIFSSFCILVAKNMNMTFMINQASKMWMCRRICHWLLYGYLEGISMFVVYLFIDCGYSNASLVLSDQNGWIWKLSLKKKMMIGACETDWNDVFQEILNQSYVTCRDLIVSKNCYIAMSQTTKIQSSNAMQNDIRFSYLREFGLLNGIMTQCQKHALVCIVVFYWR